MPISRSRKEPGAWVAKYRLTLFFAMTAVLVIAIATMTVNRVVGDLAEDNLIRIAEENTAQDALHIQSMMRGGHSGLGMPSDPDMAEAKGMEGMQQHKPLTLESLAGPEGLSATFPVLTEGLNIVKFNLLDLDGMAVWSSDPATVGVSKWENPLYRKALAGGVSSNLAKNYSVAQPDGAVRRTDVVETYTPLTDTPSGQVVGVMEIYKDISGDVALQVDEAKITVLWTTVGAMGGLFLALFGFVLAADVIISRSRKRELITVEEANQTLEGRVHRRTRALEDANRSLVDAQDQLVRTEKLATIGQMAGSVAHDLRNPLGGIKNAVYYLKRKVGTSELAQSNPKISQFLGIINQEVEHSNQIITDLLGFAHVKAPTLAPLNLEAVIEETLSRMEVRQDVCVIKGFDAGLPNFLADGELLQRVFINLVTNAQHACPRVEI